MKEYDEVAEFYIKKRSDKSRLDYNRDIEIPAMMKMLGVVKGKKILDMGCGFGDKAPKLIKKGAKSYVGFDTSKELLKFAKRYENSQISFSVGAMGKKLPYKSGSFDLIFSSLAVHYVKNLKTVFTEANRVLRRGGLFVFSTQHPVYNMINTNKRHLIGMKKVKGKRIVYGDYFDESLKEYDMGKTAGILKIYPYTFQTFIKTSLNSGFEIVDYIDTKPIPASRKYGPSKYNVAMKIPSFIIFKLKKK
ncbi:class I SAM-dependent methyltransferase [Nanoarchaeota archaeon]